MPDAATDAELSVISLDVPGTFEGVRWALAQTLQHLGEERYSVEERGTVELVLAEVLNNVVEHAYSGRDDGKIALEVRQTEAGLNVRVVDHGRPMPEGGLPIKPLSQPSDDLLSLPEGGFGWFLVGQLAHDHQYRRVDDCNCLTFRVTVG
ncbi:MAG: ATP-binding protein [Pseudomonadota bacterium]